MVSAASQDLGAGGTAFLIVLVLIVAMAFVFWAMIHSFRRLRQSVDSGTFGHPGSAGKTPSATDPAKAEQADTDVSKKISPDRNPGGAAV